MNHKIKLHADLSKDIKLAKKLELEEKHFLKLLNDFDKIETIREEIQTSNSKIDKIAKMLNSNLFLKSEKLAFKSCIKKVKTKKIDNEKSIFSEDELKEININLLHARVRTLRNLYWSGGMIGLNKAINDIPKWIRRYEKEITQLKNEQKIKEN